MTTRRFTMPKTPEIGRVTQDGKVVLNEDYHRFLGGIQDVSARVSDYVDPSTATVSTLIAALIAAGQMKSS